MTFRPITSNAPARKVLTSEKPQFSGRGAASSSSTASSTRPGVRSAVSPAPSAPALPPPVSEEELAKQRQLQVEIEAVERELRETTMRTEILRRRAHAQGNSQARLITDNEDWMKTKQTKRQQQLAHYAKLEAEAEAEYQKMLGELNTAKDSAAAASALCQDALAQRDEAKEQVNEIRESVTNRQKLIALEGDKQQEIKQQLAVVEAEITQLERKKREQMERMDELKAKVEATRKLEADALADLEQRKQVLVTLQRNIDALKKIRRGA